MELSTTTITKGRRYIYDGWMAVAERKFEAADSDTTTLEVGASKLERIYVSGANIDEWFYAAIDFNSDGDTVEIGSAKATVPGTNACSRRRGRSMEKLHK